jgi:hypothetical protein
MEDDNLRPVSEDDLLLQPLVKLPVPDEDAVTDLPAGGDSLSDFDRRYREPFTGLLFLGKLERTVEHFGHTFELHTPTQREKIEGGLLHKDYLNTISSEIAWATLTVATYLRAVDGTPLPEPLGTGSGLKERFNWVVDNLRNQIIQTLFIDCLELESQVDKTLEEFDRLGEA